MYACIFSSIIFSFCIISNEYCLFWFHIKFADSMLENVWVRFNFLYCVYPDYDVKGCLLKICLFKNEVDLLLIAITYESHLQSSSF